MAELIRNRVGAFVAACLMSVCPATFSTPDAAPGAKSNPSAPQEMRAAVPPAAVEWPQWGGPGRDFKSASKGLSTSWPAGGPRKLWTRPLGEGHSSIVADAGRLYTMYREGERESVVALDAATGRTLWEHTYAAPYLARMDRHTASAHTRRRSSLAASSAPSARPRRCSVSTS